MGKLRLIGRRAEHARCAYCRDRVAEGAAGVPCEGCGALMHPGCWDELGGCATLGCQAARTRPLRVPAPPATQPEGRQDARRRRRNGRITRTPPGLLARIGPYSRMLLKSLSAALCVLALLAATGWVVTHPAEAYAWFADTKRGRVGVVEVLVPVAGLLLLSLAVGSLSVLWLTRLPQLWRRVGELLDDGLVTPMRLRVYTVGSGRNKTTLVDLEPEPGGGRWVVSGIEAGLFFTPIWLRWRSGARVYVHGAQGPGPYVLEFEDGWLVLLERD